LNKSKRELTGWILYDDCCGFCRWWVPFWKNTSRRRGFEIAPLPAGWVREKLQLDEMNLLQDSRLFLPNGGRIQDADTHRCAMKRIRRAYPAYLFSITPLSGAIFNWSYRRFAARRHQISYARKL